jgi:3-deoxy-D-manno-octulosonate 8-phosphate phosphatase KdsC-like HAD superfamily phosphatase
MASATPHDNRTGDGENDVEFVRDAGLGVAMKNGRDAVKSVAGRVTARTNAEDGVAHELSMLQAEGVLPSTATWYDDTTS